MFSIVLCDSPGINDTEGVTVDIANTLGIPISIELCNSVRPILMLNWKTIEAGGRGEAFRENVRGLTKFFENLDNYMNYSQGGASVSILISGVPK